MTYKWNHTICSILKSGFFHLVSSIWDSSRLLCISVVLNKEQCIIFSHVYHLQCCSFPFIVRLWFHFLLPEALPLNFLYCWSTVDKFSQPFYVFKLFISSLFFKDIFEEYRILSWLFFFYALKYTQLRGLLACLVSNKKSHHSYFCSYSHSVSCFPLAAFQIFSVSQV